METRARRAGTREVRPWEPHADRAAAVRHFNGEFRHQYWLRAIGEDETDLVPESEEWDELVGLPDAGCAFLARAVASKTPRYLVCGLDDLGRPIPDTPGVWHEDFPLRPGVVALVTNPFGAGDDDPVARARDLRHIADVQRRVVLAGAAALELPLDGGTSETWLTHVPSFGRDALAREYFRAPLDREVAFIYGVPVETLRAWKQRYRAPLSGRKPGAPRRNR